MLEIKNLHAAVNGNAILRGIDPDESFSGVPYEKGALFLTEIEHAYGPSRHEAA